MLEENASEVTAASRARTEKEVPPLPATPEREALSPADQVEILYNKHRSLLLYVAARKFRVPESEAENLVQEVFYSFLQSVSKEESTKIENVRAWLVAAMCNASRHFWRASGRTESLPEDFQDRCDPSTNGLADQFAIRITVRQALQYLQPRCRETLRLHYFEGRSAGDVARELETTNRYAEKLIHNCLKHVREIYLKITAVTR
ncbi:MAG TPA: sigma-70 family RNA polymerase sigma factor [Thermoanaerobaculia bacterium]|nr:sigma-70 family RNA polymerase sigma factor [Thermoanaerobaculia bacterium]